MEALPVNIRMEEHTLIFLRCIYNNLLHKDALSVKHYSWILWRCILRVFVMVNQILCHIQSPMPNALHHSARAVKLFLSYREICECLGSHASVMFSLTVTSHNRNAPTQSRHIEHYSFLSHRAWPLAAQIDNVISKLKWMKTASLVWSSSSICQVRRFPACWIHSVFFPLSFNLPLVLCGEDGLPVFTLRRTWQNIHQLMRWWLFLLHSYLQAWIMAECDRIFSIRSVLKKLIWSVPAPCNIPEAVLIPSVLLLVSMIFFLFFLSSPYKIWKSTHLHCHQNSVGRIYWVYRNGTDDFCWGSRW